MQPEPVSPIAARAAALAGYRFGLRVVERGRVTSVGDGVAWVDGLPSARIDELVEFEDGSQAVVFQIAAGLIGTVLLRQTPRLRAGIAAALPGRRLDIGVGDTLLGRVVDPLGEPLDGKPAPSAPTRRALDTASPPIVDRDFVTRPLYSGVKIVDTLLPIGKGQRQLLIGDNGTGKSALALDIVVNQSGQDLRCIYVLIGQKRSSVVHTLDVLRRSGALAHTTVVVAEASAAPGLQYLAPFAGCAVAEAWAFDGRDTLVVYDDLSTHARTYRELSLLLRRPPGREAYPGDIFYLHARLLERSTCLAAARGGGSITALPIVETKQGEIAAYIPTNLISITDGQILFDAALFARGTRPAIDIARSVSRIGGKAQDAAIRRESGRMKLDYLQFLELEVFTRFGAHLDPGMEGRIARGRLLREILRQGQLDPLSISEQLAWLVAYNDGLLDGLGDTALRDALARLRSGPAGGHPPLEAERAQWSQSVRSWLGRGDEPAP
ncbi:F0F1 ATP synthase subunit alpha [Fontimonas sp. SYSU GA230001]|uniref:F0F1 ATP synthase subunit alpha n=1 Tax=Fontimonas sp. SYSU GA230001 TaxID=3142450 RepID=UPI0032B3E7A0